MLNHSRLILLTSAAATLLLISGLWANDPVKPSASPDAKPAATDADAKKADAKADDNKPDADKPADKPKSAAAQAEELFTKGRDALFREKFNEAIELLTSAVELDAGKTSYRMHLARALRYAGKEPAAAEQLEKILKAAPDHVEAGQALGEMYARAKKWKDVVRVLEPLLKYRHDYQTYHMLAEAHQSQGDKEKARGAYEEAIKLNPQSGGDHYQLANIYLSDNYFSLAAGSYQAALRLGIDTPVLRYKLGSALFNLRNYFGGISVQTVKSGKPGTIDGPWYLIEPVPGQKDVFRCAPENSAIYQIARAMADGIEDRPDIHVLRATIYLNARRFGQAYQLFAEIGPKVPQEDKALFYYYFAQAAFGTGQFDRYLELLQEAIKLDPAAYKATLVDAYLAVADQYNQAGQLDKYIEFLKKAVAESPQTASLHLKLGNAHEEAQRYSEAVIQWQMVLDIEADHPERMKLLSLIAKYSGKDKSAREAVERAERPAKGEQGGK